MKFTKITVWDGAATYWISGIYKIKQVRDKEFSAFFIQDHARNWGDYVPGADYSFRGAAGAATLKGWKTLESAKSSIEAHAKHYKPAPHTVKRAAERLESLIENSNQW